MPTFGTFSKMQSVTPNQPAVVLLVAGHIRFLPRCMTLKATHTDMITDEYIRLHVLWNNLLAIKQSTVSGVL